MGMRVVSERQLVYPDGRREVEVARRDAAIRTAGAR
jgi:hypothetical protein